MAGCVFDRHPHLKMALTEIRADWVPTTLDHLDRVFAELRPGCALKPSEYFRRHCLVVPSSPDRSEVEMRHEIGIDQFGFGQDYPHWERLWPNTLDCLRDAFRGVPEDELRAILIGNPGPGGWAKAVAAGDYAIGTAPDTTNQRMEVTGHIDDNCQTTVAAMASVIAIQ